MAVWPYHIVRLAQGFAVQWALRKHRNVKPSLCICMTMAAASPACTSALYPDPNTMQSSIGPQQSEEKKRKELTGRGKGIY